MKRRAFLFAITIAATAGCSATTPGTAAGPRSSSSVLTRQEISGSAYSSTNAYEAVEKLRPSFLRPRTTSSGPGILPELFVDGVRKGSIELLKSIASSEIAEIRYVSVIDATTRYGMNVPAGVLDVKLIGR
jgi:hypothetical protein